MTERNPYHEPAGSSKGGVYEIVNIANGHRYIGSSINVKRRWIIHRNLLNKGKHHSAHLQKAWNLYGENNFVFSILQEVEKVEHLLTVEQNYFNIFMPEYNILKFAGRTIGRVCTKETIKRMCLAAKNKFIAGYRGPNYGKPLSVEHRRKISESEKGKIGKRKIVLQFSKTMTPIKTYNGLLEAEKATGIYRSLIRRCCSGVLKTSGGFIWRYAKVG